MDINIIIVTNFLIKFWCHAQCYKEALFKLSYYLQIALWLYAGPSVMLRACPTCVWVKPKDSRRSLKAFANSLISSRLIPSTTLLFVWLMVGWSVQKADRMLHLKCCPPLQSTLWTITTATCYNPFKFCTVHNSHTSSITLNKITIVWNMKLCSVLDVSHKIQS